jgi:hypothetical protein
MPFGQKQAVTTSMVQTHLRLQLLIKSPINFQFCEKEIYCFDAWYHMKAVLIMHEEKSHAEISSLLANKPSA